MPKPFSLSQAKMNDKAARCVFQGAPCCFFWMMLSNGYAVALAGLRDFCKQNPTRMDVHGYFAGCRKEFPQLMDNSYNINCLL